MGVTADADGLRRGGQLSVARGISLKSLQNSVMEGANTLRGIASDNARVRLSAARDVGNTVMRELTENMRVARWRVTRYAKSTFDR
jgi:hypothetical protein